jgi:hypothetical protein
MLAKNHKESTNSMTETGCRFTFMPAQMITSKQHKTAAVIVRVGK